MKKLIYINDIKPVIYEYNEVLIRDAACIFLNSYDKTIIATIDRHQIDILNDMMLIIKDLTSHYKNNIKNNKIKILELKRLEKITNPKRNTKLLQIAKDLNSINTSKDIYQTLMNLEYKYRDYRLICPLIRKASNLPSNRYFIDAKLNNFLMCDNRIAAVNCFKHIKLYRR